MWRSKLRIDDTVEMTKSSKNGRNFGCIVCYADASRNLGELARLHYSEIGRLILSILILYRQVFLIDVEAAGRGDARLERLAWLN
jgi:hypothetical protein